MSDDVKGERIRLAAALLRLRPWDDDPAADDTLRLASCRIRDDADRLEALAAENEGYRKANDLLNKGMESQCELMDGLKQDKRRLEADLARLRVALKPFADFAAGWHRNWPDHLGWDEIDHDIIPTLGHCRAAAVALGEGKGDAGP